METQDNNSPIIVLSFKFPDHVKIDLQGPCIRYASVAKTAGGRSQEMEREDEAEGGRKAEKENATRQRQREYINVHVYKVNQI